MAIAYIGLGSNLGDKVKNIKKAIQQLKSREGVKVLKVSSLYETAPVGYKDQPNFVNAVVEVHTDKQPDELLQITKAIEAALGRKKSFPWGPRLIDLDILLYNNLTYKSEKLSLPHPEVKNRAFVLVPLAEIAGEKVHPSGLAIKELLAKLGPVKGVKKLSHESNISSTLD